MGDRARPCRYVRGRTVVAVGGLTSRCNYSGRTRAGRPPGRGDPGEFAATARSAERRRRRIAGPRGDERRAARGPPSTDPPRTTARGPPRADPAGKRAAVAGPHHAGTTAVD